MEKRHASFGHKRVDLLARGDLRLFGDSIVCSVGPGFIPDPCAHFCFFELRVENLHVAPPFLRHLQRLFMPPTGKTHEQYIKESRRSLRWRSLIHEVPRHGDISNLEENYSTILKEGRQARDSSTTACTLSCLSRLRFTEKPAKSMRTGRRNKTVYFSIRKKLEIRINP